MKIFSFIAVFSAVLCFGCTSLTNPEVNTEVPLEDIQHEVIYFEYTPDTGKGTSRLRYELKFINPNPIPIKGFYEIVTEADGLKITTLSSNTSDCYQLDANGTCSYQFDSEQSFEQGWVETISLVSVTYTIEE